MDVFKFWIVGIVCFQASVFAEKRFIVEGNGNEVDGNTITNNENTYANGSSSGGGTGGSSTSTPAGSSGGSSGWASSCDYNGHHHNPGDVFPAVDGCNKCTCSPLGPACTTNSCTGRKRNTQKKFIVTGDGNEVDGNTISHNENTYVDGSSSGGATGVSSSSTPGTNSGGSAGWASSCDYNGKHHNPGDVFPAIDGCNKCTCSPLGPACTTNSCTGRKRNTRDLVKRFIVEGNNNHVDNNVITDNENTYAGSNTSTSGGSSGTSTGTSTGGTSGVTCDYNGQHHNPGDVFPAIDGCNTCTCSPLGPACTTHYCTGKRDTREIALRFIVEGNNNHVDNNVIEYNGNGGGPNGGGTSGISPGSVTSGPSSGTTARNTQGGKVVCVYHGQMYHDQQVFPAYDGCNSCMCSILGATCTINTCGTTLAPFSATPLHGGKIAGVYHGQTYHDQQVFPAFDGCNTCMCSIAGELCTTNTCG